MVSGEEIHAIIQELEPIVSMIPREQAIIALTLMAMVQMNPECEPERVRSALKEVTQFMTLCLADTTASDAKPN